MLRTKHGMSMEDDDAVAQEGTSGEPGTRERTVIRDTLREVLFEIPGFRALAERGIPPELVAPGGPTEVGQLVPSDRPNAPLPPATGDGGSTTPATESLRGGWRGRNCLSIMG